MPILRFYYCALPATLRVFTQPGPFPAKTPSGTIGCRSPLQRSTENRRSRLWGSVFLRRVASDHGPKNFEKVLNGTARTEGLHGDASAFAQEEQFVGEQLGIT
jgi:hypothetical protein